MSHGRGIQNIMLAWLDIETTGLNPLQDHIIEIGFIITDDDLVETARKAWVIPLPPQAEISDFINEMHTKSGLLSLAREAYQNSKSEFKEMLEWLPEVLGDTFGQTPLAGSTVGFDKSFIAANAPYKHILKAFTHRVVDVSSIKELARRWEPDIHAKAPKSRGIHRSLPDLEDSIGELRYYREFLFGKRATNVFLGM